MSLLENLIAMRRPTALMIGRFQPFHDGHVALFREALKLEGFVVIGVRNTHGDASNPYDFEEVKRRIEETLHDYQPDKGGTGLCFDGLFVVIQLPNITNVVYGRGVGYKITQVELPPEIEAISATKIRQGDCNHAPHWLYWSRQVGDDPETKHRTCGNCDLVQVESIAGSGKWVRCETCQTMPLPNRKGATTP